MTFYYSWNRNCKFQFHFCGLQYLYFQKKRDYENKIRWSFSHCWSELVKLATSGY